MAAMDEIESLPHPNITDTLYTPLDTSIPSPLTAEAIAQELTASVQAAREINPEKSVPARTAWLQSDARRKAITTASKKYADRIISGDVTPETLFSETTPEQLCAEIEAVRIATLANPDLYTVFHMQIENLYTTHPSGEIHERCATYLYHLTTAGIADTDTLTKLGLALPHLAGPFSKNLEQVTPLLDEVTAMCDILETDPFLRTRVLPVTLVFGSQVKGYGTASADADVAIFVRPGTPRNERTQIETELATVFAHEKIGGKAVMFWLEATPERQLVIQDFTEPAHSDGASTFTHVLFGASWQGDTNTIKELHAKLLTNYFQHPDTKTEGAPTRQRWLEEQERDTLQYRLMHKGFARYHAVQSPYANAPLMDGNTAFYDETYRTTATKLFLEHVFLPDLNRPVKTGT